MINKAQARKYCCEDITKIENYDKAIADTTQVWHLHHRLELTPDGAFANTSDALKFYDQYYYRPANELIFLTRAEHRRIHNEDKALPPAKLHMRIEERRALEALNRMREEKRHEREAAKKAKEEAKAHKAAEREAAKKAKEEAKAHEREATKKAKEEAKAHKAAEREAAKKAKEEEKARKAAEREAWRRMWAMTKEEKEALRAAAIAETNRKLRAAYHLD